MQVYSWAIIKLPFQLKLYLILHTGPYFTVMNLADIARQLDEDERERMAEGDVTSQDYQEFLKVYPHLRWLQRVFTYNMACAILHIKSQLSPVFFFTKSLKSPKM